MKKQNYNRGSAHVVVIVILVIALLCALGFVFYQNFIEKKKPVESPSQTTAISQTNAKPDGSALTETTTVGYSDRMVTLNYPKEWTVEKISQTQASADGASTSVISSPDNKYFVTVSVYSGGLGGACGEGSTFASTKLTEMPNGTGEKVLEYTTNAAATGAGMTVVSNDVDVKLLVSGKNTCNMGMGYFHQDGTGIQNRKSTPVATARVTPNSQGSDSLEQTLDEQKAWAATDNYATAKKILLSLKG